MDPGVRCHGMKVNPTAEVKMPSGYYLSRYGLLENFYAEIPYFKDEHVFDFQPHAGERTWDPMSWDEG